MPYIVEDYSYKLWKKKKKNRENVTDFKYSMKKKPLELENKKTFLSEIAFNAETRVAAPKSLWRRLY